MRGPKYYTVKITKWREKAKQRRAEIWRLEKRKKELISSRDKWRERSREKQKRIAYLEGRLSRMEKSLGLVYGTDRPTHHKYSVAQIELCLKLRQYGSVSLRACVRILIVLNVVLGLELFRPSPTSIRNWEIKLGKYQMSKSNEGKGDWVLILDESVSVGQQKLLLLLGVNLSQYKFGQALGFADIQVLSLGLAKSWKAVDIEAQIRAVLRRGYKLNYAVSDRANNLRKALELSQISRVEDCTHALGKLIEKRYKASASFIGFCKEMVLFKRRTSLSKYAGLIPPKQRSKGRFLNLAIISKWAQKTLSLATSTTDTQIYDRIKWVESYKELIEDMCHHHELMNQVGQVLKKEGLSTQTQKRCKKMIRQSKASSEFKASIEEYMEQNLQRGINHKKLVCSSDIIESLFGKIKNKVSPNVEVGFTDSCLAIATWAQPLKKDNIKKAMEAVKIVDIENWRKENLPLSILQQKKRLFKSSG